jgi:hypothetical protein
MGFEKIVIVTLTVFTDEQQSVFDHPALQIRHWTSIVRYKEKNDFAINALSWK